ncbi:hypothetical protein HAX54_036211 [Datura stramonium]|uniref:Uncharacterized protein n=1 Tax=Datura stramonium TaxID=4076 RepID=A0ABS8VJI7_DATST|nr:hypothetical protein [Datura stramonium]
MEEDASPTQLVEIDAEDTSQIMEETPKEGKESRRCIKGKKKEVKEVVTRGPFREPGTTVKRAKGKSIAAHSPKDTSTTLKKPQDIVSHLSVAAPSLERVETLKKKKVLGGRIFDQDIAGLHGMQELLEIVRGVEISFDSITLGKILDVPSVEECSVKGKQASRDVLKLIGKLPGNLNSDRMFKK